MDPLQVERKFLAEPIIRNGMITGLFWNRFKAPAVQRLAQYETVVGDVAVRFPGHVALRTRPICMLP